MARAKSEKTENAGQWSVPFTIPDSTIWAVKLTGSEVAIVLLHFRVPAGADILETRIPQLRGWLALGKDEGDTNNTYDEEGADEHIEEPHASVVFADNLPDE